MKLEQSFPAKMSHMPNFISVSAEINLTPVILYRAVLHFLPVPAVLKDAVIDEVR